jgi:hypothetical protein
VKIDGEANIPLQADGDIIAYLPIDISINSKSTDFS